MKYIAKKNFIWHKYKTYNKFQFLQHFSSHRCGLNQMKIGKARGPSGVAIEFFKVGGDNSLKSLANIFNDIFNLV